MHKQVDTTSLQQLDRAHHLHPFTDLQGYGRHGGRIFSRAEHIYIYDTDGNKMLDGMSGLWCCGLGYSQKSIADAVYAQLQELPYYNSFFNCSNQSAVELARALVEVTPAQFNHVFFTSSGSEANDTNLRLAHRYYDLLGKPEKELIISRKNAYHGSTIAAASLGGMSGMHKQTRGLNYIHHINQPHWFEEGDGDAPEAFGVRVARELEDHRIVGQVRGRGMFAAVELVSDKGCGERLAPDAAGAVYCRNMANAAGLMVRQTGDAMITAPPLVCSIGEIDTLVDKLHEALDKTADHYGIA